MTGGGRISPLRCPSFQILRFAQRDSERSNDRGEVEAGGAAQAEMGDLVGGSERELVFDDAAFVTGQLEVGCRYFLSGQTIAVVGKNSIFVVVIAVYT